MNHWDLAVKTHAENFPDTEHDCADISQVDPRRYPATTLLWASPECTWHSQAKGVPKQMMRDTVAQGLPVEAAERSRATMWDVPRFAEAMALRGSPYAVILVENVAEVSRWGVGGDGMLFQAWLNAMDALGYDHEIICLNSMFAGGGRFAGILPAPQSRDRMYVGFWLRSMPGRPDFTITPVAWCSSCEANVLSVQTFKKPGAFIGKYRQQYVYRCPTCTVVVEPYTVPAIAAIDLELRGQRIGDRDKPLAPATMTRIQAGLNKHGHPPGLIVPLDRGSHPDSKRARPFDEPWPTLTGRATLGAMFTPFVASIRGGGSKTKCDSVLEPLATVSAHGNHHMLVTPAGFIMRNNGSKGDGGEHCTPFTEPLRTLTTKGHQSVVIAPHLVMPYNRTGIARPVSEPMHTVTTHDNGALMSVTPDINDCEFRMLQPHEQGAAMAFDPDYRVLGNKRERTRQYGNAVTPPASELLATAAMRWLAQVGLADAA